MVASHKTLLQLVRSDPALTDFAASYVIKHKLQNWEDAEEARSVCQSGDPVETGYWEYMVHVLRGEP